MYKSATMYSDVSPFCLFGIGMLYYPEHITEAANPRRPGRPRKVVSHASGMSMSVGLTGSLLMSSDVSR